MMQADVRRSTLLPRLAWHARDATRRVGLPGAVGLAILAAALVFFCAAVLPVARQSTALHSEVAALEAARHSASDTDGRQQSDPARQLAEFYRFFPKSSQAASDVARLHAAALAHNLQLEQGSYRMLRDRTGKLSLYEITLPLKGEYLQLRKFMAQALGEMPHLALDGVSFQRQKAGDTTLESQIKFTLFFAQAS